MRIRWPDLNYNGTNAQHVAFATKYTSCRRRMTRCTSSTSHPVITVKAKIHGSSLVASTSSARVDLASWQLHDRRGRRGLRRTSDPNVNQFALTGLSDSANAVLSYSEKFGISARLHTTGATSSSPSTRWLEKSDLRGSVRPDRPQHGMTQRQLCGVVSKPQPGR